jgi:hypothetical protein
MAVTKTALTGTRRHVNLTQEERRQLAEQKQMEQAVALFLDLETDHTWKDIAATLGISLSALKRLTQSGEFQRMYEDTLATVGHDPRLQSVKGHLADLLPAAYRRLQGILTNPGTDDRAALRAIEKLFEWTGVDEGMQAEDPVLFQNFMKQHGVTLNGDVNILNMNIPAEYQAAYAKFLQPQSTDTGEAAGRAGTQNPAVDLPVDGELVPPAGLPAQTAEAGSDPALPPSDPSDGRSQ